MAKRKKHTAPRKKPKHIHHVKLEAGLGSVSIVAAEGEEDAPKKIEMLAYTGGVMSVGWYGPVVIDLAGMEIPKGNIPLFRDHDSERIIGHGEAKVVDNQLIVSGVASVDNELSREFVQSSEAGFPWQASLGANPVRGKIDELGDGSKAKVNGKEVVGPAMIIRKSRLKEVSAVPLGADPNTVSRVAACFSNCTEEDVMNFEAWLKAGGWDIETLSDEQMKTLKASYEAEGHKEEVVAPVVAKDDGKDIKAAAAKAAQDAVKDTLGRVKKINAACAIDGLEGEHKTNMEDLQAKAIEENMELEDVNAEANKILRASRPEAPFVAVKGSSDMGDKALEAAILIQGGHNGDDLLKSHGEEAVEAGYKNRSIGFKDLLRICCQNEHKAIPMTFGDETIRASFTTNSTSGILSNVAGKELLDGYSSVENVSAMLSTSRSVSDFKQVSSYRMVAEGKWEEVAPSGKITHGEIAEDAYTNQAKTYGEIITLNRQMILNDDLGAFLRLFSSMGRSYAMTKEQIFWGVVKANANSFYHSDNSNLNTTNGFDAAGLTTATTAMQLLTDVKGNPINIQGTKIVVPAAKKFAAQQLIGSAQLMATGDSDVLNIPMANPFQGRYDVISSPYLDNAIGGTGSATTWYLFADPVAVASYEFAYLNGVEEPTLDSPAVAADMLGMSWRGYGDFGLAQQDPRGSAKNTA